MSTVGRLGPKMECRFRSTKAPTKSARVPILGPFFAAEPDPGEVEEVGFFDSLFAVMFQCLRSVFP
jgi:hypothetical protein